MIILHRHKENEQAVKIEEKLQDLVLAYQVKEMKDQNKAPYIEDSGKRIEEEDMESWFRELESELNWQRSLSGDGCYIDPDSGKVC